MRRDATNLVSFLVVVSLCLAVTLFAVLRITHLDQRLALGAGGSDAFPAGAQPSPGASRGQGLPMALPGADDRVISHGPGARPMVALTFDAEMTPGMVEELDHGSGRRYVNDRLLAELRRLQVPATFFLAGLWIERYPDVARGIGSDPLFEVANHSYSDLAFRPGCGRLPPIDISRATDDLDRNQTLLGGISAHPTPYFRFPGGCYDAASLAAVEAGGVQVVQYDVVPGDTVSRDPGAISTRAVAGARSGSIVVLNANGGNVAPATDRAIADIVAGLRARGFLLVRLSELLGPAPPG